MTQELILRQKKEKRETDFFALFCQHVRNVLKLLKSGFEYDIKILTITPKKMLGIS